MQKKIKIKTLGTTPFIFFYKIKREIRQQQKKMKNQRRNEHC